MWHSVTSNIALLDSNPELAILNDIPVFWLLARGKVEGEASTPMGKQCSILWISICQAFVHMSTLLACVVNYIPILKSNLKHANERVTRDVKKKGGCSHTCVAPKSPPGQSPGGRQAGGHCSAAAWGCS